MNTPLRRVGLAMLAMIVLLLANATYIQIVKADDYRSDGRNRRVLLDEYARQRGRIQISTDFGGAIIANVTETNDRLRYLRQYANGPLYAPITGFYSVRYGATGLERTEDQILNGSDDRLFVRRLSDLITGRDPRGGNVVVTINPQAQQAAYDELTKNDYVGSVVALRPQTGEILAMVSTPSFDPSRLAAHDADAQEAAYNEFSRDARNPMLNRAIAENYFPGSTFKLVIAAAALEDGRDKGTELTAAAGINVITGQPCQPGSGETTCQANFKNQTCGGGATATMELALERSCNTAFAQLAHELGEEKVRAQAAKFGIGEADLTVPMPVVPSCIGPRKDGNCMNVVDDAAMYQTGIGQRDVRLTALQNAEIVATIANGGTRMRPQLIKQITAPDETEIANFESDRMGRAMSERNATTLRDMMVRAENNAGGAGKVQGLQIASKTGTAETGNDPKNTPPYAWYVAFAPADNPKIAVAVVVESTSAAATGSTVSAAIGRATINAALAGGI
ncbi:MAG TPA: penicillin-binding protein 2 [Actinophytocola sp.]|uniref:peptidoglycan D,D-transpeptidase FtsI family protein n=1 Tax=Actinophytocola sp. TaxID=1872138 RepID=UPI002DDCA2E1|nr:penicillin-binding protein 2 [Actinophytocola sp.]HEV2780346.1 penicillin-binding protein 2 [Actinophytocola sp.]